jgi:hypothetical protein
MPVPQILREVDKSPSRLPGVNRRRGIREGRTSASLSVNGPRGPGVVGGFCRGCDRSAGEVLPVGLRGHALRKVQTHFSLESELRLGRRAATQNS